MTLKMKKGPDFSYDGNWIVYDATTKEVVANIYYDKQSSSWRDAGLVGAASHHADFLGFNKEEALEKLSKRNNPERSMKLWKFRQPAGIWEYVKDCTEENCSEWLAVYNKHYPEEVFKVSKNKPKHPSETELREWWASGKRGTPRENPKAECTKPRKLVMRMEAGDPNAPRGKVTEPTDAAVAIRKMIGDRAYEVFLVLYLNANNCIMGYEEFTSGQSNAVYVSVAAIARNALASGAVGIITAHQHPSGNTRPSADDQRVWEELRRLCSGMSIQLLDNLVIGDEDFFSESAGGLIDYEE